MFYSGSLDKDGKIPALKPPTRYFKNFVATVITSQLVFVFVNQFHLRFSLYWPHVLGM